MNLPRTVRLRPAGAALLLALLAFTVVAPSACAAASPRLEEAVVSIFVVFPLMLIYTGISYRVFRGKVAVTSAHY